MSAAPIGMTPRMRDRLTPRRQHIPTWYDPTSHSSGTTVTSKGVPLLGVTGNTFTIDEIPIERRWAVGSDGEVIPQDEFSGSYKRRILEWYDLMREDNPSIRYEGSVEREYIPNVIAYVSAMVDPDDERQVVDMHYDRWANKGTKPQKLAHFEGDKIVYQDRLSSLTEAYMNPKTRAALKPGEIAEVTQHMQQMLEEAPQIKVVEPKKEKRPGPTKVMPCGAEVPNLQSKRHAATCVDCQEVE
jgi:hypothetical protein